MNVVVVMLSYRCQVEYHNSTANNSTKRVIVNAIVVLKQGKNMHGRASGPWLTTHENIYNPSIIFIWV